MKRLEIVHLRSSGEALESLKDRIRDSVGQAGDERRVVTLYRRRGLETDLAVHILDAGTSGRRASELALRLASALRAYGLVEHTVWEELR